MHKLTTDRVQIIHGTPPAQPGKCVMCGTTEGPFIDIGFDVEFYGVVYWCFNNCFKEIANVLEYYAPDQVESIKHQYDLLVLHNKDLYKENAELRDALDCLINASKFAAARPGVLTNSENIIEPVSEDAGISDTDTIEDKPKPSKRKRGSVKQTDESGSSNIQHNDSLTELLGIDI